MTPRDDDQGEGRHTTKPDDLERLLAKRCEQVAADQVIEQLKKLGRLFHKG
nr:hypothetical protein [uncultured Cohaesibacter sp.]